MKTILIIGSNGVLGADLVRNLQSSYTVIPVNRDNYKEVKGETVDFLINANGNSRRFWANEHILEDFEASTTSVYKSIFDFTYKKYLYISSSDVYADHVSITTTKENQAVDPKDLSPYGFHKYLSETIVRKYAKEYVILRSSMILGMNLKKGPIYDVLHEKPLFISLDSKLQMITTHAIASVIEHLLNSTVSNTIFNMGGSGVVRFKNIKKYLHKNPHVTEDVSRQVYEMNIAKLKKVYPLKSSEEYLQEYMSQLQ